VCPAALALAMPGLKWLTLHALHLRRPALPGRDDRVGNSRAKWPALSSPSSHTVHRSVPYRSSWAILLPSAIWPMSCLSAMQEDSMLQLLDLARENAELKGELTRIL